MLSTSAASGTVRVRSPPSSSRIREAPGFGSESVRSSFSSPVPDTLVRVGGAAADETAGSAVAGVGGPERDPLDSGASSGAGGSRKRSRSLLDRSEPLCACVDGASGRLRPIEQFGGAQLAYRVAQLQFLQIEARGQMCGPQVIVQRAKGFPGDAQGALPRRVFPARPTPGAPRNPRGHAGGPHPGPGGRDREPVARSVAAERCSTLNSRAVPINDSSTAASGPHPAARVLAARVLAASWPGAEGVSVAILPLRCRGRECGKPADE